MAHPPDLVLYNHGVLRLVLVLVGLCLVGYFVGLPVCWHFSSCPSCACDCSSEDVLSIPLELINSSYADCGKHDPDISKEMEKDIVALLSEELDLLKIVANDTLEHTKLLMMDARRTSLHYQKEAEKCNGVMGTCEEARERAEAELMEERKLSALWEKRAREHGWKDNRRVYTPR